MAKIFSHFMKWLISQIGCNIYNKGRPQLGRPKSSRTTPEVLAVVPGLRKVFSSTIAVDKDQDLHNTGIKEGLEKKELFWGAQTNPANCSDPDR